MYIEQIENSRRIVKNYGRYPSQMKLRNHDLMESKSMQACKKRTRPYSSNDAERLKRRQKEKIQEFTDSYLIKEYEENYREKYSQQSFYKDEDLLSEAIGKPKRMWIDLNNMRQEDRDNETYEIQKNQNNLG